MADRTAENDREELKDNLEPLEEAKRSADEHVADQDDVDDSTLAEDQKNVHEGSSTGFMTSYEALDTKETLTDQPASFETNEKLVWPIVSLMS